MAAAGAALGRKRRKRRRKRRRRSRSTIALLTAGYGGGPDDGWLRAPVLLWGEEEGGVGPVVPLLQGLRCFVRRLVVLLGRAGARKRIRVVLRVLHVLRMFGQGRLDEGARLREILFPWLLLQCAQLGLVVPAREGARTRLKVALLLWPLRCTVRQLRGSGSDGRLRRCAFLR